MHVINFSEKPEQDDQSFDYTRSEKSIEEGYVLMNGTTNERKFDSEVIRAFGLSKVNVRIS